MSSILQTRQLKSMYMTAKELGLDSFMVDLRHLCAHGHDLPDLDVFQRSATYLLDWLHTFYWRRELRTIEDAHVHQVHQDRSVDYEAFLASLFHVYDTATEALHNSCRMLKDIGAGHPFDEDTAKSLKAYGKYHMLDRLSVIVTKVSNELVTAASDQMKIRGNDEIFCHVLLQCPFFMATAASYSTVDATSSADLRGHAADFVNQHQNLFRSLAICGFIEPCFHRLVQICEDDHESAVRRSGAQFWANQIAAGFLLFVDVKRAFKKRKERNGDFVIDLAPLNTDAMNDDIRAVYRRLGVNCSGVLIFGDTIRRPWTLTFSRHFVDEHLAAVNGYTKAVLAKCMRLVDPPLTGDEHARLTQIMATYVEESGTAKEAGGGEVVSKMGETTTDTIYTVEEHLLRMETTAAEVADAMSLGEKTCGIWSECSGECWVQFHITSRYLFLPLFRVQTSTTGKQCRSVDCPGSSLLGMAILFYVTEFTWIDPD